MPRTRPRSRSRLSKTASAQPVSRAKSAYQPVPLTERKFIPTLSQEIVLIPGGFPQFMQWLEVAAIRYKKKYDELLAIFAELPRRQQNAIYLEEMCLELAINPAEMLGDCVEIAYERKRNLTKLIASVAMPKVMQRNAKQAQTVKGVEDRRMFMQATGILPTPKGSVTQVNVGPGTPGGMTQDGQMTGLQPFEDSVNTFSEVIRQAVEAPAPALPEPVDVTPTDEDED